MSTHDGTCAPPMSKLRHRFTHAPAGVVSFLRAVYVVSHRVFDGLAGEREAEYSSRVRVPNMLEYPLAG